MSKVIGDLSWNQLSLWDFSAKGDIDVFGNKGYHYELHIITEVISESHCKFRRVKVGELTEQELGMIHPDKVNKYEIVGNRVDLLIEENSDE